MLTQDAVYPHSAEVVLHQPTNRPADPGTSPAVPAGAAAPDPESRPVDSADLRRLDPGAVRLWRVAFAARGAVAAGATLAVELFLAPPLIPGLLSGLVAITTLAAVVALPPLRYRHWGFALVDDHLVLRHGVLFRTTSLVPYARIQHVDTRHGPIDRWLGLASLVVYTAGTRGAIVTIPALADHDAEEIRDRLAALSGTGDAV